MVVPDQAARSIVEVEKVRTERVDPAQAVCRDVRAFEMLGPGDVERVDAFVHRLQSGQLLVTHVVVSHDQEVDVAMGIGVADRKRTLQVRPAEVLAEDPAYARDQVVEESVEIPESSRIGHLPSDSIEKITPTLLFDVTDAIFNSRNGDTEPLRALLNAGNRRGTSVPRCVGPQQQLVDFSVFCAKALAGIGVLPDTITDRSIVIRMARKRRDEEARRFRHREADERAERLRVDLESWGQYAAPTLEHSRPAGELDESAALLGGDERAHGGLLGVALRDPGDNSGRQTPSLRVCQRLCKQY